MSFHDLANQGCYSNVKYYVLIAPVDRWADPHSVYVRAREVAGVTPEGYGVVDYAYVLYVYSSVEKAQKRADLLTDVKPFELKCLSCFLHHISQLKEKDSSIRILPIIDVVLDEAYHIELSACRCSGYQQISHAYLWDIDPHYLAWSHDPNDPRRLLEYGVRYILSGCEQSNNLRWEKGRSYYDKNFKSRYCRPVSYPLSGTIMVEDISFGLGMDMLQEANAINKVCVGGHEYAMLNGNSHMIFSRPLNELAFTDMMGGDSFVLIRGDGVWLPVAYIAGKDCVPRPWAEALSKELKIVQGLFEDGEAHTLGLVSGEFAPKEKGKAWFIDNSLFCVYSDNIDEAQKIISEGLGLYPFCRELKQLDALARDSSKEDLMTFAEIDWLIFSSQTGRKDEEKEILNQLESRMGSIKKNKHLALSMLTYYFDSKQDMEESKKWANLLLAVAPNDSDAAYAYAWFCYGQGNEDSELKWYHKAVECDPSHDGADYLLGYAYASKKNAEKAKYHYEKAVLSNPFNVDAMQNLGLLLMQEGKFDEARDLFIRAINIEPYRESLYKNLFYYVVPELKDQELLQFCVANLSIELPGSETELAAMKILRGE